jgi:EF hand domain-containing protein
MRHWLAGLLLVSSWTMASAAGAEDAPRGAFAEGTAGFLAEDADRDGRVTWTEARRAALGLFEHLDRDGDGQVTRAEASDRASRWREQRFESRFARLDRDRDGGLSRWELNLPARRFASIDRDGDRRLNRAELQRLAEGADGERDTTALRSAFWRRDGNRDGRVTRAEVLAAADRRFTRQDRDRNGVLTPGEASCPQGRRDRPRARQ